MQKLSRRTRLLRGVATAFAVVATAAGLVGTNLVLTVQPASAASAVNGSITRAEVLARAQYWVDRRFTYSQARSAPDSSGRDYRTDCSGLVSMAWHLGTSYTTDSFPDSGQIRTLPSLHSLKPGDAVLRSGHMELFSHWKNPNDHAQGAYVYSFNSDGQTVQNPYAPNNVGSLGFNSWSDMNTFSPVRYKRIIDGEPGGDFNGDGKADVIARHATNSDLYLYQGNGSGGFAGSRVIGNNWSGFDILSTSADFNGDGDADILARHATNSDLYLYPGNGTGGFETSKVIGNNWSGFDVIFSAGDFDGDGNADVLARHATNSDLYLYSGNGTGGFAGSRVVGNNWSGFDVIFSAGDFNGDGKADVIARHATNSDLYLYPGNGSGGFGASKVIGDNWSGFDAIFSAGDFDGDGNSDVLARHATNSDLYLYPGNGSGGFGTSKVIGNNWSGFDLIF
ncbi:FG-GAP repeat domain-containing protein [Micromonospora sp. NPDC050397]|uniref:FG-GAP repeat domain-containing protein n=1 Tax=Micromonospora sp. NPDC050397 TaxID=3364279 RepID=UPI00384E14D2